MPSKTTSQKPVVSNQKMPTKLRLKLANEAENLLQNVKLNPENRSYKYYLLNSKQVNNETYQGLMMLFKTLMQPAYEASSWGWNESEKLAEWKSPKTRIIIVTKTTTPDSFEKIICDDNPREGEQIIGFLCFRFEIGGDKNECALYVYELHVDPDHQRQGLGQDLMKMAKTFAQTYKMDKIMLTTFTNNGPALKFYSKLKFGTDKSSPGKGQADYSILSVKLKI